MNAWTTQLMADYYLSTKLSMLRYGTTSGLEQSVNTTTDGIRVLSRNFYGSADAACLRSYYTDGTTTDGTADNCHYDPRFADWYETGLGSTKDGSDNVAVIPRIYKPRHDICSCQVVGNFYGIGDSGRLGMGVVSSSSTNCLLYYSPGVESNR